MACPDAQQLFEIRKKITDLEDLKRTLESEISDLELVSNKAKADIAGLTTEISNLSVTISDKKQFVPTS